MPTHQELSGISDQELIDRMVSTHDDRFNEDYWRFFDETIAPKLPENPRIVDIGCGPGLLIRDLADRYPGGRLTGTDITQGMIDYAGKLGLGAEFVKHDITAEQLPGDAGSVDLVSMVAVLHVLDQPHPVLAEISRVLADGGIFLLQDWIRKPLPQYLERMTESVPEENREAAKRRFMSLFAAHNKYTVEDWLWLLDQTGFNVEVCEEVNSPHFRVFVCHYKPHHEPHYKPK